MNPSAALDIGRRALAEAKRELGSQHPAYLNAVNNISAIHIKLGHFAEALAYAEETVTLRRAACGGRDEKVAEALNILGMVYTRLGKHRLQFDLMLGRARIGDELLYGCVSQPILCPLQSFQPADRAREPQALAREIQAGGVTV